MGPCKQFSTYGHKGMKILLYTLSMSPYLNCLSPHVAAGNKVGQLWSKLIILNKGTLFVVKECYFGDPTNLLLILSDCRSRNILSLVQKSQTRGPRTSGKIKNFMEILSNYAHFSKYFLTQISKKNYVARET
jgi:hypothetical protein